MAEAPLGVSRSPTAPARVAAPAAGSISCRGLSRSEAQRLTHDHLQYPAAQFEQFSPFFATIMQHSTFSRPLPAQRDQRFTAEELTARYKSALVAITSYRDDKPLLQGSGFLIRADGYLLTNQHGIWDTEKNQPATRFVVEWDAELKLPPMEATLIAYKQTKSASSFSWGVDIALLKLPGDRCYDAMPPHLIQEGQLGDPILTMGFPARHILPSLSTIVTSGIVTRLNKNVQGNRVALY